MLLLTSLLNVQAMKKRYLSAFRSRFLYRHSYLQSGGIEAEVVSLSWKRGTVSHWDFGILFLSWLRRTTRQFKCLFLSPERVCCDPSAPERL